MSAREAPIALKSFVGYLPKDLKVGKLPADPKAVLLGRPGLSHQPPCFQESPQSAGLFEMFAFHPREV